jgi:hypothetical protein
MESIAVEATQSALSAFGATFLRHEDKAPTAVRHASYRIASVFMPDVAAGHPYRAQCAKAAVGAINLLDDELAVKRTETATIQTSAVKELRAGPWRPSVKRFSLADGSNRHRLQTRSIR